MQPELRNRPRVFLSHSKANVDFIERVRTDFGRCQIDSWLDSIEIRHGQSWQDAIFGSGIPTCDAVLVYLTPDSVVSPMVKKEIDAALISKLQDSRVGFLPYVSTAALRGELRADLQALQTNEWNADNYDKFLPCVVAEVWRSYCEKTTGQATNEQRVRRLEAEKELARLREGQGDSPFSGREKADFSFIWEYLERWEPVEFALIKLEGKQKQVVSTFHFEVSVRTLMPNLDRISDRSFDEHLLRNFLRESLGDRLPGQEDLAPETYITCVRSPNLAPELLMFGFVEVIGRERDTPSLLSMNRGRTTAYSYHFTAKMYRFKYWIAHSGNLAHSLLIRAVDPPAGGE